MSDLAKVLDFDLVSIGEFKIKAGALLLVLLILGITKLLLIFIKKGLHRRHVVHKIDKGTAYAIYQIISYFVWVLSIVLTLETIGVKVSVLLAGSAALLVGVGLGLQQTFNDIISGIILLSERTIKVEDVLEIDGDVIKITSIGLRTSTGMNRDEISIIIPNSLITTNKVINWSHQRMSTRFKINVGVAYGSDVDLVLRILKESVLEHPEVSNSELVNTRFLDFGASSLDFQVLFFSTNIFRIENVKSDIRKIINRKFVEHKISIPFPQVDLHIKSDDTKNE
jgi:small-conductance mechanosensitive channel